MAADIQRTIEIIFGATDNTGQVLSNLSGNIQGAVDGVSNVTAPLSDMADKALLAESAVVALGIAMLSVAVNESAQLQKSINEIGTLYDATPAQVDAMKQSIISYGAESVFAFDDITQSTYDMVSATGDAENAVGALATAEQLAVVGGTSLGTSVNAITGVINAYGLELSAAEEVTGAFFVAVQNGRTTLPELEANIGRVAATASASGVSFDELLASVAALTGGGIQTAESMTSLQAIFTAFAKPTKELKTALGGMTLETDGLQAVMRRLQDQTNGNFTAMSALFPSVEAVKGALILGADSAGTFDTAMQGMADKATVVSKNFDLMEKNLNLVTQNMRNQLTASLIAIGDELIPGWSNIVQSIGDIFNGVRISIGEGAFDDVFNALNDFELAFSAYLSGIADALPQALSGVDFNEFIASLGGIGDAIAGIFDGLDLTKPEDLAKGIQFIVDSASSLNKFVTGIIDSWRPALQAALSIIDEINNADGSTTELAGNVAGYAQQFEAFKGAINNAATAIGSLGTAITTFAGATALRSTLSALSSISNVNATGLAGLAGSSAGVAAIGGVGGFALGTALQDAFKTISGSDLTIGQSLGSTLYDWLNQSDIDKAVESLKQINPEIDKIGQNFEDKQQSVRDFDKEVDAVALSSVDLDTEINAALLTINEMNEAFKSEGFSGYIDDVDELDKAWAKSGGESGSAKQFDDAVKNLYERLSDPNQILNESEKNTLAWIEATKRSKKAAEEKGKAIAKVDNKVKALTEREKLAIEQTGKMEQVLKQLASNEKIAQMEFRAQINVAEIQSQAKIVESIFNSTAQTVGSLSSSVDSLYNTFGDLSRGDWISDSAQAVQDAALRQEERMQRELDIREELASAQIDLINRKIALYESGGGEIVVTADNLAPELQAVLDSLIDNIRIQAQVEGLELLL